MGVFVSVKPQQTLRLIILASNNIDMKKTLHYSILSFMVFATAISSSIAQSTGLANPIISEIMYNPPEAGNDTLEFLEIYNPNLGNDFSLGGAYFSSGIEYTFPAGYSLAGGAYVVISGDSLIFDEAYGVEAFEWTGGTALSNDGEGVTLRNGNGIVLDSVFYDDTNAWADADATGYSLVLCNTSVDNNLPMSWTLSEDATGLMVNSLEIFASPGSAGTCTPTGVNDQELISTVVYPNPTEGAFYLKFKAFENNGNLRIFNSVGQVVYTQTIAAGTSSLNSNINLKSGFYILSIENDKSVERHNLVVE